MKSSSEKKLCKKYSFYNKRVSNSSIPFDRFGFSIGEGWYKIIEDLSEKIKLELDELPDKGLGIKLKWYDIPYKIKHITKTAKETFKNMFTISMRISKENIFNFPKYKERPFLVFQVKEKFGLLRFYPNYYTDEIKKHISAAESLSFKTCEKCGTTNNVKLQTKGWRKVLCDKCSNSEDNF